MLSVIDLAARRPHECIFCQASFNRPDALKRHWTTCKTRLEQSLEIPQVISKPKGRKTRACDRCSRLKRACMPSTGSQSCQSCLATSTTCSYKRRNCHREKCQEKRIVNVPGSKTPRMELELKCRSNPNGAGWQMMHDFFNEYTLGTTQIHRPTAVNLSTLARFSYLGNVINAGGIAKAFECGTSQYRLFIRQKMPFYHVDLPDQPHASFIEFQSQGDNHSTRRLQIENSSTWPNMPLSDREVITLNRSCEIVDKIRTAITTKSADSKISISWSSHIETKCLQFFSPTSIERYLSLFWFGWHPNCPFMHRPSFNSMTSYLNLVIAMTVIGACISPVESDRAMANVWFNVIEEIMFSDEVLFGNPIIGPQKEDAIEDMENRLNILQAAYCVCLYQTWEGPRDNRRRMRRQRYNTIIWLAREMGLKNATLDTVSTQNATLFNWREFILRESMIRLFAWIYNLDAGYTIFFQEPPRMLVEEADMDMPSPEVCFQAESPEECFLALKSWRANMAPQKNLTLSAALKAICSEPPQDYGNVFSVMGVGGMFTIISVFCSLTFNARNSAFPMINTNSVRRGLRHWRRIWPSPARDLELGRSFADSDPNRWKRIGFIKHAAEFWLLNSMLLDQTPVGSPGAPPPVRDKVPVPDDIDMTQMNDLIAQLRGQMSLLSC